jgi:two-component system response regulator NreC
LCCRWQRRNEKLSHISVIIADDHEMLREGLRLLLATQTDIEVIGEAEDGIKAVELARALKPDVILLDIAMPNLTGLEALIILREVSPQTRVIMLSSHHKEAYVHQAFDEGAFGYIVKGSPSTEVITAIRKAAKAEYYLSPDVQAQVIAAYKSGRNTAGDNRQKVEQSGYANLSEREKQVFHLSVEGNSSIQIGELLCISSKTVDKHRTSICKKLVVENPVQMLHYAIRIGILDPTLLQS